MVLDVDRYAGTLRERADKIAALENPTVVHQLGRLSLPTVTIPEVPADLHYDPYDYDTDRNPHPVWKRLRDEAPLYFNEQHGFYALSRYQDVLDGLLDWETYSSARGTVLEIIQPGPPAESPSAMVGNLGSMIFSDPPGHDIARRIVNREFTPKKVERLEARLRRLCREAFDALDGRTEFDFLGEFAARIPPMIIGEMLGVPEEDQEQLGRWVDMFMHYDPDAETGDTIQGIMQFNDIRIEGAASMGAYMADAHRAAPAGSGRTTSSRCCSTPRSTSPTAPRAGSNRWRCRASSSCCRAPGARRPPASSAGRRCSSPDTRTQRAKLLADRSLLPNAVEELLRYEAPSPIQARYVTRDVDLYGVTVPAGSKMALLNGSAGRDEREYPDPDRFDVDAGTWTAT